MIKSWPDKVEMVQGALKNNKVLEIFVDRDINKSGCVYVSTSKKEDNDLRGHKVIVLVLKKEGK